VREQLWQLYSDLKAYKLEPTASQAEDIKSRFQAMCGSPYKSMQAVIFIDF